MWPAPAWLDDRARRVWLRLGGDLREAGLLTVLDRDIFLILCTHIGRWVQIQEEIKGKSLMVDGYKNPLLTESRQLGESIRKMAGEFGLEPAARARALALAGDAEEEPDDLAALLFRHATGGEDE